MNKLKKIMLPILLCFNLLIPQCNIVSAGEISVPEYSGSPYVAINDNVPDFTDADLTYDSYETYSELDSLGRCGTACANIGTDLMPVEERGSIGQIKPSGWHTVKYDCVDGNYLYNRCHLIGYQLTAENDNEKNLITGTRYMNVEGMLPFENMTADYIKETGNHVLYRVTPVFEGNDLVAKGVQMEAESVEDNGDGILFNVFCYNVQPGVSIDYATGDSWPDNDTLSGQAGLNSSETTYILNINTKKFHYPSCSSVSQMNEENRQEYTGSREELIGQGYSPCKRCNP
ncbi:MAG: DNA/RNA non-specific endonuclease [Clostridia bacterium]|nr:DNA/RNA non-specific endonuclease [Clostridia bacterium]MDY5554900.1 DNA/RNA non-specific endonuclease [Blautia sp.]